MCIWHPKQSAKSTKKRVEIPKKGSVLFAPSADMGSSTTSTARKATNLEEAISFTNREREREGGFEREGEGWRDVIPYHYGYIKTSEFEVFFVEASVKWWLFWSYS